jgi:manganese/zinc/iron transport system permease protein
MLRHGLIEAGGAWPTIREVAGTLATPVRELGRVAGGTASNLSYVVLGAMLLGIGAAVVGSFTLLRKRALVGDALSHAALPGIAIAFVIGSELGVGGKSIAPLLTGAAISGVLGVLTIQFLTRHTRLTGDAAIGAVLSVFFGAGVVLLSIIQSRPTGNQGGLTGFIYGQTAGMSRDDALLMGLTAIIVTSGAILLLKEFSVVCFDDGFASAQGWPVGRIDLLMMAMLVLVVVVGLQAVGLILVMALLIVPPASARFWTDRLGRMVALAAFFGGLSGYVGATASALLPRMPAGAVIVLTGGSVFLVSFLVAPRRGLLAVAARRLRLRLRVGRDHLLRAMYEVAESRPDRAGVETHALTRSLGWSPLRARLLLMRLEAGGLLSRVGDRSVLTERGSGEAQRVTRNHRIWEQYLITYADVAAGHADFSADLVEHVLSAELVDELAGALRRRGVMPEALPDHAGRPAR